MICSSCQRDASDNPVAYYLVKPAPEQCPDWEVWTCWLCLSPEEKTARDHHTQSARARRFKMEKTIKEMTP